LIQRDATEYRRLVTELQAGNAVLFPLEASASPTPVRVILGDFLGLSGSLHNGTPGVQVQIFSRDLLSVANTTRGALIWSSDDWWEQVTAALRHDGVDEADLPADGVVQQYQVVEFLLWINDITWASEWPKYLLAGDRPGEPVSRVGI
jgi:hypothetical protein